MQVAHIFCSVGANGGISLVAIRFFVSFDFFLLLLL